MEGDLDFQESLAKRMNILNINKDILNKYIKQNP